MNVHVKHYSQGLFYNSYQTIRNTYTFFTLTFFFVIGVALVLN